MSQVCAPTGWASVPPCVAHITGKGRLWQVSPILARKGVPVKFVVLSLLLTLFLTACASSSPPTPTPNIPATVTSQVQAQLTAIPTPSPVPSATPYPTLKPLPTSTPWPTYTPYPTLTLTPAALSPSSTSTTTPSPTPTPVEQRDQNSSSSNPFFPDISGERTVTVAGLLEPPAFWEDEEPFALLGCYVGDIFWRSPFGQGEYGFSSSGNFNEASHVTVVSGYVPQGESLGRPGADNCYAMLVKFKDRERMCLTRGQLYNPLISSCPGWMQDTSHFVMVWEPPASPSEWLKEIPKYKVR